MLHNVTGKGDGYANQKWAVLWCGGIGRGRNFADAINKNGGNATLVELPKIGIRGNTHFLMQDLNNRELADLLHKWLKANKLN